LREELVLTLLPCFEGFEAGEEMTLWLLTQERCFSLLPCFEDFEGRWENKNVHLPNADLLFIHLLQQHRDLLRSPAMILSSTKM
jgi:hypothetical protein